jgi:hypothetical protein
LLPTEQDVVSLLRGPVIENWDGVAIVKGGDFGAVQVREPMLKVHRSRWDVVARISIIYWAENTGVRKIHDVSKIKPNTF